MFKTHQKKNNNLISDVDEMLPLHFAVTLFFVFTICFYKDSGYLAENVFSIVNLNTTPFSNPKLK